MTALTVHPWAVMFGDRLIGRPGEVDRVIHHNGFWHYLDADGTRIGKCSHFARIQILRHQLTGAGR